MPGWLNIGVLHTALEGNASASLMLPASRAARQELPDNWALLRTVITRTGSNRTTAIACQTALHGRTRPARGPAHGALLVSLEGTARSSNIDRLEVDVLRWRLHRR